MTKPEIDGRGFSLVKHILILLGCLFIGVFLSSMLSTFISPFTGYGSRSTLLIQASIQNILAFMLPAWGCMKSMGNRPFKLLGLEEGYSMRALLALILAAFLGMAALNQIIYWNAEMKLPESLSNLEETWRKMEETNAAFTQTLISDYTYWGLISGVLVVGVLTGIGEEMFFRGAMQGSMMKYNVSTSGSIWVTAVIFSLMHFQMFGFVPRILLGAWFGYLYWWSGSLWLSATAHALNNSLVVIFAWLKHNNIVSLNVEMFGVSIDGFPWMALISAILFSLFILYFRGWFLPRPRKIDENGTHYQ